MQRASSLEAFAAEKLALREAAGLARTLVPAEGEGTRVLRRGKPLVSFASNDYLGLASDPRVVSAYREVSAAGARSSRLVQGNHPTYADLEAELAASTGAEAALVFGSGYAVNAGVIPALLGPEDLIVLDAASHACVFAGARLAGCALRTFPHADLAGAKRVLQTERARYRHCILATEGVFGMDGDLGDLRGLADLAETHDGWLFVDDAHASGVLPGGSRGWAGLSPDRVPLLTGTLSKGLGGYGGFLASSATVRALMVNRARTLVYSTGLPPGVLAAAAVATRIAREEAWRGARVRFLAAGVAEAVARPEPGAAILTLPMQTPERALAAQEALEAAGLWVPAIRPPTVPEGGARLRISLSAAHTDGEVDQLIEALERL